MPTTFGQTDFSRLDRTKQGVNDLFNRQTDREQYLLNARAKLRAAEKAQAEQDAVAGIIGEESKNITNTTDANVINGIRARAALRVSPFGKFGTEVANSIDKPLPIIKPSTPQSRLLRTVNKTLNGVTKQVDYYGHTDENGNEVITKKDYSNFTQQPPWGYSSQQNDLADKQYRYTILGRNIKQLEDNYGGEENLKQQIKRAQEKPNYLKYIDNPDLMESDLANGLLNEQTKKVINDAIRYEKAVADFKGAGDYLRDKYQSAYYGRRWGSYKGSPLEKEDIANERAKINNTNSNNKSLGPQQGKKGAGF